MNEEKGQKNRVIKTLITRCDDFGSARAADSAILEALEYGFVKNVSCMAIGPHIDVDAGILQEQCRKYGVCVGLHAAVNAEWDYLKFLPVLPREEIRSLLTPEGMLAAHPMMFKERMPLVEEVMKEVEAQLDRLTNLGLQVSYLDSHMLPELMVSGMTEAMTEFAEKKGLVDHRWFYSFASVRQPAPEGADAEPEQIAGCYEKWMASFEEKQYIAILHPAKYSLETGMFRNIVLKGDSVAKGRDAEYRFLTSDEAGKTADKFGITCIRYTDAKPQGDTLTPDVLNL